MTDEAREYVLARGGTAFVNAARYRCCSAGSTTLLDVTTDAPADRDRYATLDCGDVAVSYLGGASGEPRELSIELRGRIRRRLAAYWDGCAFKI